MIVLSSLSLSRFLSFVNEIFYLLGVSIFRGKSEWVRGREKRVGATDMTGPDKLLIGGPETKGVQPAAQLAVTQTHTYFTFGETKCCLKKQT